MWGKSRRLAGDVSEFAEPSLLSHQRKKKKINSRQALYRAKDLKDDSRLLGDATPSLALDATLVGATTDAEVTLLSPVGVPGVGAKPVLHTVGSAVAEHLNSVATLIGAAVVIVDTAGVAHEIRVDLEGNLDGTVSGDLGLDVGLAGDGVGLLTLVLLSGPVLAVLALLGALGGGAGIDTSSVGAAGIRDNTGLDPVLPGAVGITTLAGTAAGAAEDILRREAHVSVVLHIVTIAHGLGGTESPAGAALPLITDLLHGSAAGPLGAGIERLGSSSDLVSSVVLAADEDGHPDVVKTKKAASLALGHASDAVVGSPPEGLLGVDLIDHLGGHSDLLLSEGDHGEHSNSNNELVHSR